MEELIKFARATILDLWQALHMSQEERKQFSPFFINDTSDELLDMHEQEIARLSEYLEALKPILSLIDQRQKILEEKKEFEATSSDPTRLLKKAGDPGRLLKEERFRKVIAKELPKLEEKLRQIVLDWESKNQKPFLFNGQRLLDQIELKENRYDDRIQVIHSKSVTSTPTTPKLLSPKYHLKPTNSSTVAYNSPVASKLPLLQTGKRALDASPLPSKSPRIQ